MAIKKLTKSLNGKLTFIYDDTINYLSIRALDGIMDIPLSSGSSGAVNSVNNKTGNVILTGDDIKINSSSDTLIGDKLNAVDEDINNLKLNLSSEISRAEGIENALSSNMTTFNDELSNLSSNLTTEISRAEGVETQLGSSLANVLTSISNLELTKANIYTATATSYMVKDLQVGDQVQSIMFEDDYSSFHLNWNFAVMNNDGNISGGVHNFDGMSFQFVNNTTGQSANIQLADDNGNWQPDTSIALSAIGGAGSITWNLTSKTLTFVVNKIIMTAIYTLDGFVNSKFFDSQPQSFDVIDLLYQVKYLQNEIINMTENYANNFSSSISASSNVEVSVGSDNKIILTSPVVDNLTYNAVVLTTTNNDLNKWLTPGHYLLTFSGTVPTLINFPTNMVLFAYLKIEATNNGRITQTIWHDSDTAPANSPYWAYTRTASGTDTTSPTFNQWHRVHNDLEKNATKYTIASGIFQLSNLNIDDVVASINLGTPNWNSAIIYWDISITGNDGTAINGFIAHSVFGNYATIHINTSTGSTIIRWANSDGTFTPGETADFGIYGQIITDGNGKITFTNKMTIVGMSYNTWMIADANLCTFTDTTDQTWDVKDVLDITTDLQNIITNNFSQLMMAHINTSESNVDITFDSNNKLIFTYPKTTTNN